MAETTGAGRLGLWGRNPAPASAWKTSVPSLSGGAGASAWRIHVSVCLFRALPAAIPARIARPPQPVVRPHAVMAEITAVPIAAIRTPAVVAPPAIVPVAAAIRSPTVMTAPAAMLIAIAAAIDVCDPGASAAKSPFAWRMGRHLGHVGNGQGEQARNIENKFHER
jgi:hypothetical protein